MYCAQAGLTSKMRTAPSPFHLLVLPGPMRLGPMLLIAVRVMKLVCSPAFRAEPFWVTECSAGTSDQLELQQSVVCCSNSSRLIGQVCLLFKPRRNWDMAL